MKTISTELMKKIDKLATEKYCLPSIILMENAGRSTFEHIIYFLVSKNILPESYLNDLEMKKSYYLPYVMIVCGSGNNAGDGLVTARHLYNHGIKTKIFLLKEKSHFKGPALTNLEIVLKLHLDVVPLNENNIKEFQSEIKKSDLIIDSIFGIGLSGEIKGFYKDVIYIINKSKKPIIAVDVPSGIDSNTGNIFGTCIKADITLSMHLPKKGLYTNKGKFYSGKIVVGDIGIPKGLTIDG